MEGLCPKSTPGTDQALPKAAKEAEEKRATLQRTRDLAAAAGQPKEFLDNLDKMIRDIPKPKTPKPQNPI